MFIYNVVMKNVSNQKNKESWKIESWIIKDYFFITIFEKFKSSIKSELLSFYVNTVEFDNGNPYYKFTKFNPNNAKAFEDDDFIKDEQAEKRFYKQVYQTVKKSNGFDYEASLFNWLLKNGMILEEEYSLLLEIRKFRNLCVHELDGIIDGGIPFNIDLKIDELIRIRKKVSKEWYLNIELPTNPDPIVDDKGEIVVPDDVYSILDLEYDLLFDVLFKKD